MHSPFGFFLLRVIKAIYTPPIKYAKKLRFKGVFDVETSFGKDFKLYNNAFLLETHIFWLGMDTHNWENKSREIWCDLAGKSETIFDVGANVGIFSVLAKANNNNATVVAFEPQPNIYDVLKKNNQVNNFDIICENLAVSDEVGTIPFYNHGPNTFSDNNTTSGSLNKDWRPIDQNSIDVNVVTLNNYVKKNSIRKIDLMKVDVETLEYEVLKGYGGVLIEHLPILLLEIQSEKIGKNVESLLTSTNYVFYSIDEENGLIEVANLGHSNDNNYILCPKEKTNFVAKYL